MASGVSPRWAGRGGRIRARRVGSVDRRLSRQFRRARIGWRDANALSISVDVFSRHDYHAVWLARWVQDGSASEPARGRLGRRQRPAPGGQGAMGHDAVVPPYVRCAEGHDVAGLGRAAVCAMGRLGLYNCPQVYLVFPAAAGAQKPPGPSDLAGCGYDHHADPRDCGGRSVATRWLCQDRRSGFPRLVAAPRAARRNAGHYVGAHDL